LLSVLAVGFLSQCKVLSDLLLVSVYSSAALNKCICALIKRVIDLWPHVILQLFYVTIIQYTTGMWTSHVATGFSGNPAFELFFIVGLLTLVQ